jgi:hypothetical protein
MVIQKLLITGLIGIFFIISLACQNNSKDLVNITNQAATPTEKVNDFNESLKFVQDANFDYIYAFRRKDDGEFNKEDKTFVKQNTPFGTNQRVLTQDGKVVIVGSNFKFTAENLENLRNRFNVEDYSTKIDDSNSNVNAVNVNKVNNGNVNKVVK